MASRLKFYIQSFHATGHDRKSSSFIFADGDLIVDDLCSDDDEDPLSPSSEGDGTSRGAARKRKAGERGGGKPRRARTAFTYEQLVSVFATSISLSF